MNPINSIQDEIIEEFAFFGDWMEKYEYIIDLGKSLPLIDEQYKDQGVSESGLAACR
jgi:cysteine desulfuration protein SufE